MYLYLRSYRKYSIDESRLKRIYFIGIHVCIEFQRDLNKVQLHPQARNEIASPHCDIPTRNCYQQ